MGVKTWIFIILLLHTAFKTEADCNAGWFGIIECDGYGGGNFLGCYQCRSGTSSRGETACGWELYNNWTDEHRFGLDLNETDPCTPFV